MRRSPLLAGGVVLVVLTVAEAPPPVRLPPALRLRTTVSVNGACPSTDQVTVLAATSVTYCYTVTNTGPSPARDIVVRDARGSVRIGALAGGQSRTVARTVVVTSDASLPVVASEVGTATEPTVAGAAEAASMDDVTPAPASATTVSSDGSAQEDVSVSDGQAAGVRAPMASLATGLVFLGSATPAAPATTLQSP
ncbi:MAG TPA: hypothetical protein VMQ51_05225 [Candidatus Binatia bacterium]|nr:hypothetical protein [Candidatus Binatia bacterium]